MFRILVFILFAGPIAVAQSSDGIVDGEEYAHLFRTYQEKVGRGSAIWNGPEYTGADQTISGHPNFNTKSFQYGSIIFDGNRYDSLLLAYDIFIDELVLVFSESGEFFTISPSKEKISLFTIGVHPFIQPSQVKGDGGFFELLYDGETQAIAKRKKITTPFREGNFLYKYREIDRYFVRHEGKYVEIGSKGSFLNLYKDRKKEFKALIRKYRLDFGTDPERFLSVMCNYIDNPGA